MSFGVVPLWSHYLEEYIFVGAGAYRHQSSYDELITITPFAVPPVSLADVKDYLRIDDTFQDQVLNRLIRAATTYAQGKTGVWYAATVLEYRLAEWLHVFPNRLALPAYPIRSLTSLTYVDANGTTQTVDPVNYSLVTTATGGGVLFADAFTYPAIKRGAFPIRIRFVAGFNTTPPATGDDPALTLPDEAAVAIMMMVANWYENRGDVANNNLAEAMKAADSILQKQRVYR